MNFPDFYTPAVGWKRLELVTRGTTSYTGGWTYAQPSPRTELRSPYVPKEVWWPRPRAELARGWKKAACSPYGSMFCEKQHEEHECPAPGVARGCGFYSHYHYRAVRDSEGSGVINRRSKTRQRPRPKAIGARVAAVVLGGGHLECHEYEADGFRAEYMKVIALLHPGAGVLKEMRRIAASLGVPLFMDPDEAWAYGLTRGVDMWAYTKAQMEVDALEKMIEES